MPNKDSATRSKNPSQLPGARQASAPSTAALQRSPVSVRQLIQRAFDDPSSLTAVDGAHLQRSIGNRAIGQILAASAAAKRAASPGAPAIQTKLTLGPAGDKYEQEADRTAKQVMRSLDAPAAKSDAAPNETLAAKPFDTSLAALRANGMARVAREYSNSLAQRRQSNETTLQAKPLADGISRIQRAEMEEDDLQMKSLANDINRLQRVEMEDEDEIQARPLHGLESGEVDPGVAATIGSAKGGGAPLHDQVRASMERGFGADFSGVRVHTGRQADALNRSLNAKAFTSGRDLFFRQGEYNPGSRAGQELIAHELTHTVQQGATGVQRKAEDDGVIRRWPWSKKKKDEQQIPGRRRGSMSAGQIVQDEQPLNVDMTTPIATARLATDQGGEGDVGHAWVELRYDEDKVGTYAYSINRLPIMPYGKQRLAAGLHDSWGFYPRMYTKNMANQKIMEKRAETGATPGKGKSSTEGDTGLRQFGRLIKNPAKQGSDDGRKKYIWASVKTQGRVEEPDDDHIASARMKYRVSQKQIESMTRYIDSKSSATYSPYGLNCTSFAVDALKAAGQSPPSGTFFGFSYPSALHDLIAKQKEKRNQDAFVRSGGNLFGGLMGQKDTKDPEAWEGVSFN